MRVHQDLKSELSLRQGLPGIRKLPKRSQPLTLEQGIQQRQLCWISAWVLQCVKQTSKITDVSTVSRTLKPPTNCSCLNMKGVNIKFPELAMLPNPLYGLLSTNAIRKGRSLTVGVNHWQECTTESNSEFFGKRQPRIG